MSWLLRAPEVNSHRPHVAMTTTSRPWPWAGVIGEREVAAEARNGGRKAGKEKQRGNQIRGLTDYQLMVNPPFVNQLTVASHK